MLRSLDADAKNKDQSIWVVAPIEEAETICSFFRIEQIKTPLVLVPKQLVPDRALRRWLIFARLDSHGKPVHNIITDDVDDMLAKKAVLDKHPTNVVAP